MTNGSFHTNMLHYCYAHEYDEPNFLYKFFTVKDIEEIFSILISEIQSHNAAPLVTYKGEQREIVCVRITENHFVFILQNQPRDEILYANQTNPIITFLLSELIEKAIQLGIFSNIEFLLEDLNMLHDANKNTSAAITYERRIFRIIEHMGYELYFDDKFYVISHTI